MGRGPTDPKQKMGLSRNLLASMTDKRGPRFGETSYNERARPKQSFHGGDPNDAKLELRYCLPP